MLSCACSMDIYIILICWILFCFFQAEDGIRDLVRSRGLGDVYKRQRRERAQLRRHLGAAAPALRALADVHVDAPAARVDVAVGGPVSYTHLTLPTSDLV